MTVTQTSGALNKFRRTTWRFQQTVELPPVDEWERFITLIFQDSKIKMVTVTIDEVIFNTERLDKAGASDLKLTHDSSIVADSIEEIHTLLMTAFWDGVDFICVPTPKPFVFYADHHNWITFFANTKSNLNRVVTPLVSNGYKLVQNWHREL